MGTGTTEQAMQETTQLTVTITHHPATEEQVSDHIWEMLRDAGYADIHVRASIRKSFAIP